jgi:hypothetical protein
MRFSVDPNYRFDNSCINSKVQPWILSQASKSSKNIMLHHMSISVNNPLHVANVLAEIMQGRAVPFPPHPGSYMVLAGDKFGTAIELYPIGTELIPDGTDAQVGFQDLQCSYYSFVHAAISVPTNLQEIERIGARERWQTRLCDRDGLFNVVEFWLENRLMLEFLTPAMASKYLECFRPENLSALIDRLTTNVLPN